MGKVQMDMDQVVDGLQVNISGSDKISPGVVVREMDPCAEGNRRRTLQEILQFVRQARRRLQRTAHYDEIEMKVTGVPAKTPGDPPSAGLDVALKEKKRQLSGGVSVNRRGQLRGHVQMSIPAVLGRYVWLDCESKVSMSCATDLSLRLRREGLIGDTRAMLECRHSCDDWTPGEVCSAGSCGAKATVEAGRHSIATLLERRSLRLSDKPGVFNCAGMLSQVFSDIRVAVLYGYRRVIPGGSATMSTEVSGSGVVRSHGTIAQQFPLSSTTAVEYGVSGGAVASTTGASPVLLDRFFLGGLGGPVSQIFPGFGPRTLGAPSCMPAEPEEEGENGSVSPTRPKQHNCRGISSYLISRALVKWMLPGLGKDALTSQQFWMFASAAGGIFNASNEPLRLEGSITDSLRGSVGIGLETRQSIGTLQCSLNYPLNARGGELTEVFQIGFRTD